MYFQVPSLKAAFEISGQQARDQNTFLMVGGVECRARNDNNEMSLLRRVNSRLGRLEIGFSLVASAISRFHFKLSV